MARLVRHEATGPTEVKPDPDGKSAWICACGLSQNRYDSPQPTRGLCR
ncbi:MAG: hypothetical protein AAGI54_11875 [Planctomycetota bacterium]